MTTLYRAAEDDFIRQGCCFAEDLETAELYTDNPGFGGPNLYTAETDAPALDLRGMRTSEVSDLLGISDMGAAGVDEWIARDGEAHDAILALGYSWALVSESYPAGTTTWIWVGDSCDEPELEEVS